jgi:hypothetical protein
MIGSSAKRLKDPPLAVIAIPVLWAQITGGVLVSTHDGGIDHLYSQQLEKYAGKLRSSSID